MKNLKTTLAVLLFMLGILSINAQINQVKTAPVPILKATKIKTLKDNVQKIKGTMVAPNGKHYFFTDKRYFRYSKANGLEKIANTKTNWSGIPDNIDAIFVNPKNKKAYFFKGSKYYRYDFKKKGLDNPEMAISRFWKGVPNDIDAAVAHPNGKIYFFKGDTYYRYDPKLKKVDNTALISKYWKGVPNNVDAVLLHANGKIYFFKGTTYFRYNIKTKTVDKPAKIGATGYKGLDFNKKNFTKKIAKPLISKTSVLGGEIIQTLKSEKVTKPIITIKTSKKCSESESGLTCTTESRKFENAEIDQFLKKSNSVIETPGNIINGNDLFTGVYKNIKIDKNKYSVFINTSHASTSSEPQSIVINNPNDKSELSLAINKLKKHLPNKASEPRNAVINVYQIESETDAKLKIGGSFKSPWADISGLYDFNSKRTRKKYLIEYTAVYYSISLDKKNHDFIISSTEDINPNLVYVDEVKYGKRFYFALESDEVIEELETKFNASSKIGKIGSTISISSLDKLDSKNVTIKQVVQGGQILSFDSEDFPGNIIKQLTKNTYSKSNPGAPISSVLRFVNNNNVAQVSTTADYTERVCFRTSNVFKIDLESIYCEEQDDNGSESEVYGDITIYIRDKDGKKYKPLDGSSPNIRWKKVESQAIDVTTGGSITIDEFKTYKIPQDKLQNAELVIHGRLIEEDIGGNDFLGELKLKIPLRNVTSTVTVGDFDSSKVAGQRPSASPIYGDGKGQRFYIPVNIEPMTLTPKKDCK